MRIIKFYLMLIIGVMMMTSFNANADVCNLTATASSTPVSTNGGNDGSVTVTASGGSTGTVTLFPTKDNSIYSQNPGNSNGAGDYLFGGEINNGNFTRALLAFDIAGNVPSGATITGVTLTLYEDKSGPASGPQQYDLHQLLEDWGEGTSNGIGLGAPATPGDATWTDNFFGSTTWTNAGGTYNVTVSGSTLVSGPGSYYSWSSAGMTADVQSWLNTPATNYGWLLKGQETTLGEAKRFDSRENPTPAWRPTLTVNYEYTSPPYSYNWSNGGTASSVSGLPAGTYNVTVTDANTCTATATTTVTQPPLAAPIPTLNEWGLIALGGIVLLIGGMFVRRIV